MGLKNRLKHSWNAFRNNTADTEGNHTVEGPSSFQVSMPRARRNRYGDARFARPKFAKIALDASLIPIKHIRVDEEDHLLEYLNDSRVARCLNISANIDQTHLQFLHDLYFSLMDEGHVAIVPVETSQSPEDHGGFQIRQLRVGQILEWKPRHVRVRLYDDIDGIEKDIWLEKTAVGIVENPMYAVLNDQNVTLQRLTKKLAQLDYIDEITSSGRLDLIIQMPYSAKTELARERTQKRIKDIEEQISKGSHGIAYVDSAERIIQLNRPINNQLVEQVRALEQEFYNQLGLTEAIFNGTASEAEQLNYYNSTIDPLVSNTIAEMQRKFISRTAYTQGQRFRSYRDPFKHVPVTNLSTVADTFSRNEILTPNEIRAVIGRPPSKDPNANILLNRNINHEEGTKEGKVDELGSEAPGYELMYLPPLT